MEETLGTSLESVTSNRPITFEDPLAHLPCATLLNYRKGQTVYNNERSPLSIYLVIQGRVKVCRLADDSRQVMVDIYTSDEFFGESAFVGHSRGSETAVAMDYTKVMAWTTNEIEEIAVKRPKLAIALLQLLAQRSMDFGSRIESLSVDNIPRRLARSLIRFSERLGSEAENGSVKMIPLTHELLSQYVGTSREIVTHYMNQFRRKGFLNYSREGILLQRDVMRQWLRPEESFRPLATETSPVAAQGSELRASSSISMRS